MPQLLEAGHELISGSIGMGKSYWVVYKIIMSLIYGYPCCYIDPKGDTYQHLLAFLATTRDGRRIWEAYKHRILFINPVSSSGYILGFNALEPVSAFTSAQPDRVALLANSITSHIRRQSGFDVGEAMRMQNILAAAIGTLASHGGYTMAELPLLFVETYHDRKRDPFNPFVESLLPQIEHLWSKSFWVDQWANWTGDARREWVQSTLGRIFQYLFDERMLYTVCTVNHCKMDFRRLVDEGYWLFVNIPYPLLSETITTVLGNFLTVKIIYACMQRSLGSRPYRLILDEARFFNTGPLDQILETARAYNLSVTLVVQSLTQMARAREGFLDWHLMETAKANARYWSVFQDYADKDILADMMFPVTGEQAMGIRVNGDPLLRPPAAEENRNQRVFTDLGFREVVVWDKLKGSPKTGRTPQVVMDPPEQRKLDLFEAQHLQLTGAPASSIRAEIVARQERVRKMLKPEGPVGRPAQMGGIL